RPRRAAAPARCRGGARRRGGRRRGRSASSSRGGRARRTPHCAWARCSMRAMNVVFLGPSYPPEMQQYTRGLAEVGAQVYGVGDTPVHALPASLKPHLHDYLQVPRILNDDDVVERVTAWLRGREVDRVLANWEVMVLTAARLREQFGLPGMTVDAVNGFRDKQIMK